VASRPNFYDLGLGLEDPDLGLGLERCIDIFWHHPQTHA